MPNKEGTPNEPSQQDDSQNPGLESETSMGEGFDEGQNNQPDPSGQDPIPVDPYAGTPMEGKSPGEIRAYLSLLENTVREQSTALTRAAETPPPPEPQEDVDFFTDPRKVLRQELEVMVKPLNDQITEFRLQNQVNGAWEQARQSIPDFAQYEGYVKQIVQGQNIRPDQVNLELLKSLYYTAVGYVARHGGPPTGENTMGHPQPRDTRQATPPVGVPQHRPSSAPLPTHTQNQPPKLRKLTENEARLAREWNMTHEEYLRYQDAEAEEVLTMDVGGNNE